MKRYTEQVQVTLPTEQKRLLQLRAKRDGISLSELMRRIIDRQILGSKDI
jgi:hypothetical protein